MINKKARYFFTQLLAFLSGIIFCCAQLSGPNQGNLESYFANDDSLYFQVSHLDSLITWQEHIVLHIDKSILKKEEPVFFKAYALTGPNRLRASLSKVLKVELLNSENEIVLSQYHKLNDGMAEGAIAIPRKLDEGSYTLRAYTRWMQNYGDSFYFTKQMELGSQQRSKNNEILNPISVTFHPEGGQLIASLKNKMLIKVNQNNEETIGLEGEIVDENNKIVAKVVSFGSGFGSVIFTPKASQSYRLKMENDNFYDLPEILTSGYVLNVNNLDEPLLSIRIESNTENINDKLWLSGKMNGITYFKKEVEFRESLLDINILTHGIPGGLLMVSLYDNDSNLWAKRPVEIEPKNNLKLNIVSVEEDVEANERRFKIRVTDSKGKPVSSEVSLSATTIESAAAVITPKRITNLNWDSQELDDNHKMEERKKRFMSDLEILTLAKDSDLITQKLPENIKFPVQKGLDLFGLAYNLNNELLKNTQIQLLGASDENVITQAFETDAFGRVRLENLQLMGETELIFRTAGDDSSSRLVKIVPFQELIENKKSPKARLDFRKQRKGRLTSTSPWQPDTEGELVVLDEVEVSEKKKQEKKTSPSVYGVEPNRVVFQDIKRLKTMPELFLGIPHFYIKGMGGLNPTLIKPSSMGQGPTLWVVDGMPLSQSSATPMGASDESPLSEVMSIVSFSDIERIEILSGANASIYGSRASGGAILIYTRSGADMEYVDRKEGRLNFQGYFESPTFKEHIDEVIKKPKKYVDSATTLFWSPNIKTDKNGEATIRFKVPFDYKHLELKACTITEKGEVGSTRVVF